MTGTDDRISNTNDQARDALRPKLAVVVPVHNEADNVAPLIAEIRDALEGRIEFEIIYVDDASADETPVRLKSAAMECRRLRVLRHGKRSGQSAAIATGVEAATAPIIATLDGDGQNDPADIPKLLERLNRAENPDRLLVAGQRTKRQDSDVKRISSKIANATRRKLLGDGTPDTGCGLKLFTRTAFLAMPRFNHMHRFLPALMIRLGGEVVSVPVNHRHRAGGATKYGVFDRLWVGIVDLMGVMWLQKREITPAAEEIECRMDERGET
ncbi:MAG: glycosyltransferase family 2 protein [Rhodospirillales bacterium]|nr:glycosyltransferase family 2 protein [Rhodospirillales bacterium]